MINWLAISLLVCLTVSLSFTHNSNCSPGQRYISNGAPNLPNGCGSDGWMVDIGKAYLPFDSLMQPCCNAHDICYGECEDTLPPHEKFNKCNSDFRQCNKAKCAGQSITNKILCYEVAESMYEAVQRLGYPFYKDDQKDNCMCQPE